MQIKISNYIENIILQKKYVVDWHVLNWNRSFLFAIALGLSSLVGSVVLYPNSVNAQDTVQNQVSLSSEIYVVRTENDEQGNEKIILKDPKDAIVVPGDKLKFVIKYINNTGQSVTGFRATNPIPAAVRYIQVTEEWADVSVDGGDNWGKLEDLSVLTENEAGDANISRSATAADVTHVRWVFNDVIAKDGNGSLSYEGIVK